MTETSTQDQGPGEKAPGWYPDRTSPNVQKYWDGSTWIAQRRWMGAQWVNEPFAPAGTPGAGSGAVPGMPGNYAGFTPRPSYATSQKASPTVSGGGLGLLLSSVLLIVGSFTPWVTVSLAALSISASGTDSSISQVIGVNGWITFACGLLLFILACMSMISREPLFRTGALVIAVVATAFALYDLVRIIQKTSQSASPSFDGQAVHQLTASANVGWGLIVAVIGAVGALLCAISEARRV